jgi:excisionase family DNA binding protein
MGVGPGGGGEEAEISECRTAAAHHGKWGGLSMKREKNSVDADTGLDNANRMGVNWTPAAGAVSSRSVASVCHGKIQLPGSAHARNPVDQEVSLLHQHKYSVPEAADLLNISETKVRSIIKAGQLPVLKLTRAKVLIMESDLETFLQARHGCLTATTVSRQSCTHALPEHVTKSELFQAGRSKRSG